MDGIDPQKARLTLGVGPASFANLRAHWARLVELAALASVADAVAQVVQVRHRDAGEALIADLCVNVVHPLADLFGARSESWPCSASVWAKSTASATVYKPLEFGHRTLAPFDGSVPHKLADQALDLSL